MVGIDLTPRYELTVAGSAIGTGVTQLIRSVSVEYAEAVVDMVEIEAQDPDLQLTESKLFEPGNELDVLLGYGPRLRHSGRYIVARPQPSFSADSVPTLKVKGYSAGWRMMGNGPDPKHKKKGRRGRRRGQRGGRAYKDERYSDAVSEIAASYGFAEDIDPTPHPPKSFVQIAGMTDFEFVRGLANLTGFLFWVDGDAHGRWTIHFRDPEKIYAGTGASVQEKKYTFRYNDGEHSTLLSFNPDYAITDARTKVRAEVTDPITGKTMAEEIEEEENAPDLAFEGEPEEKVKTRLPNGAAVRIFFDNYSVETVADRRFSTAAELKLWLRQWFRKAKENFIMGRGSLVGVEDLRAVQIHRFEGIGAKFSGNYYFGRVRHTINESGYVCDFNARKVTDDRSPTPADANIRRAAQVTPRGLERARFRAFPGGPV